MGRTVYRDLAGFVPSFLSLIFMFLAVFGVFMTFFAQFFFIFSFFEGDLWV